MLIIVYLFNQRLTVNMTVLLRGSKTFAVCLFISYSLTCIVCRSQARRQPNFGFLMMKCPQRLLPRSAVNP